MEIVTVQEKENPFFKRKDLILQVRHVGEATPSKQAIRKALAEKYGVALEQVEISYIFTRTGVAESKVKARLLKEKPKEVKHETQNSTNGEDSKQ